MELSIVIVNYNAAKYIKNCLISINKSLNKSALSYEVIVVDSHSDSHDLTKLHNLKKYHALKIIKLSTNLGFGYACNTGIRKARGKIVLLLNPDCIVIGDSLQKLYSYTAVHKQAFIGAKLYDTDMTTQPSAGPFLSIAQLFFFLYLFGETFNVTKYSPEYIYPVDWVSGAVLAGYRSLFNKVGLFDAKIFLYMEDMEFLYRAKKMGYSTIFFPQAEFIHHGTVAADKRLSLYYLVSGIIYFSRKHYSHTTTQIIILLLYLKIIFVLAISYVFRISKLLTKYKYAYLALKK